MYRPILIILEMEKICSCGGKLLAFSSECYTSSTLEKVNQFKIYVQYDTVQNTVGLGHVEGHFRV